MHRGAKTQNFSDSNFLCAKTFPEEAHETVSRDKPKKCVFASHSIVKECKQLDSCETVQKMGNDMEKSGELGKWEMIWKNLDTCETVRNMGNKYEKFGQF